MRLPANQRNSARRAAERERQGCHMNLRHLILGLLFIQGLLVGPLRAEQTGAPPVPQVGNLKAKRLENGDVVLSWNSGKPPFIVFRSTSPNFHNSPRVENLTTAVQQRSYVDPGAAASGRYWYRVFDANSPPEIFAMTPPEPAPDTEVVFHGVGFGSDRENVRIMVGGEDWEILTCSNLQIRARVPKAPDADSIMLYTPTGTVMWGFEKPTDGVSW